MYLVARSGSCSIATKELLSLPGITEGAPAGAGDAPMLSDFRRGLVDALAGASADNAAPEALVVGLTSFWRRLKVKKREEVYTEVLSKMRAIAREVANIPCWVVPLSDRDESLSERRAAEYAAQHSELGYSSVDLVVSGGAGEIRLSPTTADAPIVTAPLGLKRGGEVVTRGGLALWETECVAQLGRAAGRCGRRLDDSELSRTNVIATGSSFYGGKFAGLVSDDKVQEHTLRDVLQRIGEKLQEIGRAAAPISEDVAHNAANLVRIRVCLGSLFDDRSRDQVYVVFARDWIIEGIKFRSTWTSGFFITTCVDSKGRSEETALQRRRQWMVVAQPGLLELVPKDAEPSINIQCFEDELDAELHEVPYSTRMRLLDVMPASPRALGGDGREVVWTHVEVLDDVVGVDAGRPVGLRLALPAATERSRFLVVAFVSDAAARRAARADGMEPSADVLPAPALGFNRRLKARFPVADLGVVFDAKTSEILLLRGAVAQSKHLIMGSVDAPWSAKEAAVFHIWLARSPRGRLRLHFARNLRVPMRARAGGVEAWRCDLDDWPLEPPLAAHLWLACAPAKHDAEGSDGVEDPLHAGASGWSQMAHSFITRQPRGCRWLCGQLQSRAAMLASRLQARMQAKLPRSIAMSLSVHHEGEAGIRTLATWPPARDTQSGPGGPGLLVTAGEHAVWCFASDGKALYRCSFADREVWGVAILGVEQLAGPWASKRTDASAGLRGAASCTRTVGKEMLRLRLLVGFKKGEVLLQEQDALIDCPTSRSCRLREVDGAVEDSRAWGSRSKSKLVGHTDAVTRVLIDYVNGLVYTVSYDRTAIQWDTSGNVLSTARGYHSDKIYTAALSRSGQWLATAGFDHVGLFRCDAKAGLACVALIASDWEGGSLERWFAVDFVPETSAEQEAEDLPLGVVIGNNGGKVWLLPIRGFGEIRRQGGQISRVSACARGFELSAHRPHKGCVRSLLWMEEPRLRRARDTRFERLRTATTSLWRSGMCRWAGSCWRSSHRVAPQCSSKVLRFPMLVSGSADRTIRVWDWDAVSRLLQDPTLGRTASSPQRLIPGRRGSSVRLIASVSMAFPQRSRSSRAPRRSVLMEDGQHALEIAFHQGAVRAAGCDAYGRLYTASSRIAQWERLHEYTRGDVVLQPKLQIRQAFVSEVIIYFTNIVVFAFNIVYLTGARGAFASKSSGTSGPSALSNALSALSLHKDTIPLPLPFINAAVFIVLSLSVLVFPNILRTYYTASLICDSDDSGSTDSRELQRQRRRMVWTNLTTFVIFGWVVNPTFQSFVSLMHCPGDAGLRRVMEETKSACYQGWHFALVVLVVAVGALYFPCALLLETVNFNMRGLLESKLGSYAAFPNSATSETGREITLRRCILVMFGMHRPDLGLELPRIQQGIFTETGVAIYSRQVRFISKVLLAGVSQASWVDDEYSLLAISLIALANLLVNCYFPPLLDARCSGFILVLLGSSFASSVISVVVTWADYPTLTQTLAVVHVVVTLGPTCLFLSGLRTRPVGCCRRRVAPSVIEVRPPPDTGASGGPDASRRVAPTVAAEVPAAGLRSAAAASGLDGAACGSPVLQPEPPR